MADATPCLNCGAPVEPTVSTKRNRVYPRDFCNNRCSDAYRYKTKPELWTSTESREKARRRSHAAFVATRDDPVARERKRAADRASYRRHAEKRKAQVRAYADRMKSDPRFKATRNMAAHRRRALKAAAPTYKVTARDWRRLLERHRHRCAYCGGPGPLTQEHVVPITRGGAHSIGNLLPVCGPCNSSKRDLLLSEWRFSGRPGAARIAS